MNLLLYTESKIALGRLTNNSHDDGNLQTLALDPNYPLPDSLFEELGYYSALDDDGQNMDESFDGLLEWLVEPVLNSH